MVAKVLSRRRSRTRVVRALRRPADGHRGRARAARVLPRLADVRVLPRLGYAHGRGDDGADPVELGEEDFNGKRAELNFRS